MIPRTRVRWTAEEDRVLRQMWSEGASAGQIAKRIGRSRDMVIGRVQRLRRRDELVTGPQGVALESRESPLGANPNRLPDETINRIQTLHRKGWSAARIMRLTGVGGSSVYKYTSASGL